MSSSSDFFDTLPEDAQASCSKDRSTIEAVTKEFHGMLTAWVRGDVGQSPTSTTISPARLSCKRH